mgnify:CR=1 FL=1
MRVIEEATSAGVAAAVVAHSRAVALWTLVSRGTGFVRVAAIAAALGPTFFGNLFQTAILVPYVLSQIFSGSLVPSYLTPHLVRAMDDGDEAEAGRLAGAFLKVLVTAFATVALIGMAAAPGLAAVLTLGNADPLIRERQIALGIPLLVALLPQVVFQGIAAVGIACQFARRRFAFATAVPIIENLGVIGTVATAVIIYGSGHDVGEVTLGEVLLLGLGASAASAAHAGAQIWGATRAGFRFNLSSDWRAAGVMAAIRMALASSGTAGLAALAWLIPVIAAGRVAGGSIAFQLGLLLFNLPLALAAQPVATTQLPYLAGQAAVGGADVFNASVSSSLRMVAFVMLPAGMLFLALPDNLAAAVAVGGMSDPGATAMVADALAGLGIGLIAEGWAMVTTSASYARLGAALPLQAASLRLVISIIGVSFVLSQSGARPLLALGLAASASAVVTSAYLLWRSGAWSALGRADGYGRLAVNVLSAAAAVGPVGVLAAHIAPAGRIGEDALTTAGLLGLSGLIYVGVQLAVGGAGIR